MDNVLAALALLIPLWAANVSQDKARDAAPAVVAANDTLSSTQTKEPSEKQQAQRQRMKDCNEHAGDAKGNERKEFMSACLRSDPAPSPAQLAQREKMKVCNREATEQKLAATARKDFMSSCLRG